MAEKGLQVFLDHLVVELEGMNSEALREEYDFEPHTFVFEPTDLSDIMIKAAADQTQYGWTPSDVEIKYMKDQALIYGALLVDEVKDLGGSDWGTKGCSFLMLSDDKNFKVVPMGWEYRKTKNKGKTAEEISVQSAFNKVKVMYKTQLEAYFQNLQEHFGKSTQDKNPKRLKGFRQSANRTVDVRDEETGEKTGEKKKIKTDVRATSGSSLFRVTGGHKHGEGIVETAVARAMEKTAAATPVEMNGHKLDLSMIKKGMKELGIKLTCVRATDGEGFVIRMEYGPENGAFGNDMKGAKDDFILACKLAAKGLMSGQNKLVELKGSDSILTRNRKLIIKQVVDQFKKNKKVVSIKHENIKLVLSKAKATTRVGKVKLKKEKRMSMAGAGVSVPKAKAKARKRRPKPNTPSLATILGFINMKLPKVVQKNMGLPGLENQTGRFAGSVIATDVNQTAQGYPSIGYTYQKDRYQVYETTSGSRLASPDRDPRPLIDESIREIVMQLSIGRIYTRRL